MPAAKTLLARRQQNSLSNTDLLNSFELHMNAEGKSEHTKTHYLGATQHFLNYCAAENLPGLANVSREHVELWLSSLYKDYASATVRNRFVGLQQFFKWLLDEGEITRSPMDRIKRPVVDETSKDIVPASVMGTVFSRLEKAKGWRECAVLAIFYDTGMRETELADTLTVNVSLQAGEIFIPKTKNHEQRTVAIGPKTVRYIDRYWRTPRKAPDYLVSGHRGKMTGNGLYQLVRSIFEDMGFPAVVGPHDLRHTSASALKESGMEDSKVMRLMGWRDPKMVRRYSAQVQQKIAIAEHRLMSPMENMPRR